MWLIRDYSTHVSKILHISFLKNMCIKYFCLFIIVLKTPTSIDLPFLNSEPKLVCVLDFWTATTLKKKFMILCRKNSLKRENPYFQKNFSNFARFGSRIIILIDFLKLNASSLFSIYEIFFYWFSDYQQISICWFLKKIVDIPGMYIINFLF